MYSGILCDLCLQTNPEAVRVPRFHMEADIQLDQYGRNGRVRRSTVVAVELDVCLACFKKRDPKIVRVRRLTEFSDPLRTHR